MNKVEIENIMIPEDPESSLSEQDIKDPEEMMAAEGIGNQQNTISPEKAKRTSHKLIEFLREVKHPTSDSPPTHDKRLLRRVDLYLETRSHSEERMSGLEIIDYMKNLEELDPDEYKQEVKEFMALQSSGRGITRHEEIDSTSVGLY
jgi:hypothetical protein